MDVCQVCDCPATIETVWGDDLCLFHYEHGPTADLCPNCNPSSPDVTPAAVPVAAVDDRPCVADAAAPPGRVGTISPVVGLLPPESTTGELTLADIVQAVEWCITRAYDSGAPDVTLTAADAGLTLLRHVERGVRQAMAS